MTNNQFKCLVFFSMLYVGLGLCAELLVYRPVTIFGTVASAGSLVSPLWFLLSDIVAELYGYKAAKNMMYCMFFIDFICASLLLLLINLPAPIEWQGNEAYQMVLGSLLQLFMATWVGLFIGGFLNIRLLTKWKVLLNGRYFWLRSLGASVIGQIVFTGIGFSIMLYGTDFQSHFISMTFWGIALKILINLIFSFPATILIFFLKKADIANVLKSEEINNPFLDINRKKYSI